ncbi:MAG: ABC transporter transmembrane domain-containing protein [bacterium]|nr:ABC transporter transmembrane domain-containing protein [bacterium]
MSSSASTPDAIPPVDADPVEEIAQTEGAAAAPVDPATASDDETARRRPKGKDLKPLRGLLPFVARYKGTAILALIALVASTAVTLSFPMAFSAVIDTGFGQENAGAIDRTFLVLIGVGLLAGLTSSIRFYLVSWIGERVVTDLRAAVFDHIVGQSPAFFEKNHTGEIQARLTTDTTLIKTVVGSTVSIALRNAFMLVGATALLFWTSPRLAGLVLIAIPLILAPLLLFGRLVRRLSRRSQDTLADTNVFASEALSFIQTVQAFTHEAADRSRYRNVVEVAFDAARARMIARAGLTALVMSLVLAFVIAIVWIGARDVLEGSMTGGDLSSFVMYALMSAVALAAVAEVWGDVQLAAGAAERLFELLGVEPEIEIAANPVALPEPPVGLVEFAGVDFRYPTRPEVAALSSLGFRADPGETVAIVGPSGAGKSTVLRLLLRFYDPQAGAIRVDGVDVRDADPRDVRARMSIVPQETAIFTENLRENIRYGRPEATDAEVEAAAAVALVDEFVRDLPRGYDTMLGENGMTLSGGQRQRVAIARAVLKDAPILLLDEATSSLDSQSERLVQQALERLMKGRTTIVIAHRLATVRGADRILVVDGGRVVSSGRHEALVAEGGLYADLARMQLTGAPGDPARGDAA